MADIEIIPAAPVSPAPGVASSPEAAPGPLAAAPASATPEAPAASIEPAIAAAAPVVPASPPVGEGLGSQAAASIPPLEAAADPDAPPRSLLGDALAEKKAEAPKPAEKADEAAKTAEKQADSGGAQVVTPPGEPIKWDYSIPETVKLDDAGRAQVNGLFDKFAANPRDKEAQQALVDYHAARLAEVQGEVDRENRKFWNKLRGDWRDEIQKDPEMGNSSFQTTQATARRMIDMAQQGWGDAQKRNFEQMIETTGVGDHPAFYRLLKSFARFYDEPSMPPSNPTPPADIGKRPGRGRLRDLYAK